MKAILISLLMVLFLGCASQKPKGASNYETDLIFPEEAYPLQYVDMKIYESPLDGVSLKYIDVKNPTDYITVYVYPIKSFTWDDEEATINDEMSAVIAEIDYVVDVGHYKSRGDEENSKFIFHKDGREYSGLKSEFTFTDSKGVDFDSFAYLFISKDKFIKFRTSFVSELSPDWSGDEIVKALLPDIEVPDESAFMSGLRKQHKQQVENQLLNLLLQSASEKESSEEE